MELDELKYQIKNKLATDHTGRSDADIAALLTKRTVSVTDKLKKSLWFEIICCLLIITAFALVGIAGSNHALRIYFSVFAILSFVFLFILFYLLSRISKLSGTALPVKSNLQAIVTVIEDFMKRYFQFTMALIPICFIFSLILGYTEKYPVNTLGRVVDHFSKEKSTNPWLVLTLITAYMIALAVGVYYFTKWYLKKLYGNYVVQLKGCIAELQESW